MTRHATQSLCNTQLPNQTPAKYFTPKIFTKDIQCITEFSDYSVSIVSTACTQALQKDMSPTCSETER